MQRSKRQLAEKPTLDDWILFDKVCRRLQGDRKASMSAIARWEKQRKARLTKLFQELDALYGVKLLERRERKSGARLTPAGLDLHARVREFLKSHQDVKEWGQSTPTVTIAATSTSLMHLLPGPWVDQFKSGTPNRVEITFLEKSFEDVRASVAASKADFGLILGPDDDEGRTEGLTCSTLKWNRKDVALDRVAVCHPAHRFAGRDVVRISDLLDQKVCFAIASRLVEDLPPEIERQVVGSYGSVLAFTRLKPTYIGIVPGTYDLLDDLRRQGLLVYLPMPGKKLDVAVCYRQGGREALSDGAKRVLSAIESHIGQLVISWQQRQRSERTQQYEPLSTDKRVYEALRWGYYIGRAKVGEVYRGPEWRRGRLEGWTVTKKPGELFLSGRLVDLEMDVVPLGRTIYEYEMSGSIKAPYYVLTLNSRKINDDRPDNFGLVFNWLSPDKRHLLGYYTGLDDNGWPVTAPEIHSQDELSSHQLSELLQQSKPHILMNAEVGFDTATF